MPLRHPAEQHKTPPAQFPAQTACQSSQGCTILKPFLIHRRWVDERRPWVSACFLVGRMCAAKLCCCYYSCCCCCGDSLPGSCCSSSHFPSSGLALLPPPAPPWPLWFVCIPAPRGAVCSLLLLITSLVLASALHSGGCQLCMKPVLLAVSSARACTDGEPWALSLSGHCWSSACLLGVCADC